MPDAVDYVAGSHTSVAGTVGIAVLSTAGGDIQKIVLVDATGSNALTPAQEGTDSTDTNAVQAAGAVGTRGWLSTITSLLRSGAAKVWIRDLTYSDHVSIAERGSTLLTDQVTFTTPSPLGGGSNASLIVNSNANRICMTLRNIGSNDAYIGFDDTTTPRYLSVGNGFPLYAGTTIKLGDAFDSKFTGPISAICAAGTGTTIAYWQESN
jgi:hypothetical protein